MRAGFLQSSRYSPGNMDRESLETLFVGRDDLMEDVLARVEKSILGTGKHYLLLVGPRGSGKTHFLALLYHRLMDLRGERAHGSVAVALLKEEEWGVASFLDLVVRILRALAHEAPELDAEIADVLDEFSKDPAEAEALALARLRHHTRGKTLLLLCENLVDLFDGLGDEGQKRWRAAIQEDGNWAIVASTPSLFSGVMRQDTPFYGFFTVRALDKIDFEIGLQLLVKKAMHEGKMELAEFLRTPLGRARARAIHHLAAGNHRAYVVLFDFLDKESLDDLVRPFMHMVDDLTPYYQDRIRQLAPAQRKIVEFLCLEGKPKKIKDISRPCLMSHQTAAKQIAELQVAGFVGRKRIGRNTFCELSEPLMRICMEVKDNRTQYFRLFVELLRHWFTNRELERRQVSLQHGEDSTELEQLIKVQAAAATQPLAAAMAALGIDFGGEEFERDEGGHLEALAGILAVSVENFGPRHLPEGLVQVRELFAGRLEEGMVGRVLTGLLRASIGDGFAGDLGDWERALKSLAASLADLPDCSIPLGMLGAAVRHAKTGDERHLLSLPVEQRQLLEDIQPSATPQRI